MITIFGRNLIEDKSIQQIANCYDPERGDIAVLTADAHYGYGHPIGGAVAYEDRISVSGVGFDIGCGNKAVKTTLRAADVDIHGIMSELVRRISFGIGRNNNEPAEHPVLEEIRAADFSPQRSLASLADAQLGTVGAGNHFVDLFKDEDGFLWVGVHFGSRGFGHKTAMGFIALSQGLRFTDKGKEGGMDSMPIIFDVNSALGQDYLAAMELAGRYAYAGRDIVVDKVLEILGEPPIAYEVHNHHNFAWRESHFGQEYWVVRKGCTPAFPGQMSFIGANMAECSVIVEGIDSEGSRKGLFSTVHGAGRVMSRTQARGKRKKIDGEWVTVTRGTVDFDKVKMAMAYQEVDLRGGGADEAPQCYKRLTKVLEAHKGTIRVLHALTPIGVAMAGEGIEDPYKD
jgi:tRNA-splicing ligase RtcB